VKKKITITLADKILKNVDSIVDRLYIRNRSQAVEYLIEKTLGEDKTAVILATGPEKDLRVGKDEYRITASFGNTSVIESSLCNLRENGFKKIFIVGEQEVLTSVFKKVGDGKKYGVHISFVEDQNPPGTGESLRLLKGELKNTFLLVHGDILFNKIDISKIWKHHFKHRGIATLMITNSSLIKGGAVIPINKNTVDMDGDMIIKSYIRPKKALKYQKDSNFAFASIFVAEPEIFSYTGDWVENDIFPVLAEKQLLYGYLSSGGGYHIHSIEDAKQAQTLMLDRQY